MKPEENSYVFSNNWFGQVAEKTWNDLFPKIKPERILEVGSFEGRSTCWMIQNMSRTRNAEIHCVDTWEGGAEHQAGSENAADMKAVETRFHHNTEIALKRLTPRPTLYVHKGASDTELPKVVLTGRKSFFDFIYIDGSHESADTLFDALLCFKMLRIGGVMAFDDYLWTNPSSSNNILSEPKYGIDCFVNCHRDKLRVLQAPLYQLFVQKFSE